MKHTPGPWTVDFVNPELLAKMENGRYEYIADFSVTQGTERTQEEENANAQMASAAPEMYEALNWLIHLSHDTGKKGGRPEPGEWEEAIKQGEQSLKKARGEGE